MLMKMEKDKKKDSRHGMMEPSILESGRKIYQMEVGS
jgi:hypothetical protein